MNTSWETKSVGDIVAQLPKAAEAFQAKRIDFCCGGRRLLGDVIREQGLDGQEIAALLDRLSTAQNAAADGLAGMDPADLADYIQGRHHAYLRNALPEISEVFAVVLKAHGAKHPALFQVHGLFGKLRTDLEQHLVKEEVLLFPAFAGGISAETVELARQIVAEHEAAGAILKQMRTLTDDYTAPQDACRTYRLLLEELEDLESDLFRHIHLENNILLKDVPMKGGGRDD